MKIKEYLKLSRSFNAGITACAPVLGALSMWNVNETSFFWLFILFLIGYFGHTYGFALNDILDVKIDQTSTEIKDRPLVCKTITMRNAWIFTLSSAAIAFLLAIIYAVHTAHYFPILILFISSILTTIYDVKSKKYPLMDIFVAGGIFFLILYGATTVSLNLIPLAWLVCSLGTMQVLFMQFIAGGLKDIENDFKRGANTLAVKMGVRIKKGILSVPISFKIFSYSIQIIELILLFTPFFLIKSKSFTPLFSSHYVQIIVLFLLSILMLYISHQLITMKRFERKKARKLIGSHFQINYLIVPLMLMAVIPWTIILAIIPLLFFLFSNIILHGTILQPKTM